MDPLEEFMATIGCDG
jgi:WD40 repeat protein